MKKKDTPLAVKKAASLMGQVGGKKVSKKKLDALRESSKKGGRRPGVKLVKKPKKEHKLLNKLTIDPNQVTNQVKNAASLMGQVGGKSRSEKKVAASRVNAKKGGAPRKYPYKEKIRAILVLRDSELLCIIPDIVAADPKAFKEKTFPAYHEDKRYNVRVKSYGEKGIFLRRV